MTTNEKRQMAVVEDGAIYEVITNLVIKQLEAGIVPWKKPWEGLPFAQNLLTGQDYRGINRITTNLSPYDAPFFLTLEQINQLEGKLKEGEIPIPVVSWKEEKENGESTSVPESQLVWNVEQTEGIDWELPERTYPGLPLDEAEGIVEGMPNPPRIMRMGLAACYFQDTDTVQVPAMDFFENPHNFYEVLFHQLAHATGTASRLARDTVIQATSFEAFEYSLEELTAELTSQALCNIAGLKNDRSFTNSPAYIKGWLDKLRDSNLFIFVAASQSKRAVDYILG